MTKKQIDPSEVRGALQGDNYETVRASYDTLQAIRAAVGRDIADMSFSEYVLALAVVTAAKMTVK